MFLIANRDWKHSKSNAKIPEIKVSAAVVQTPFLGKLRCRRLDASDELGRKAHIVMSRQNAPDAQALHPLNRMPKCNGIGRRIKHIQTAAVDEIAREQIAACFFKKTTMPGRMPRRVQDRQRPVSKFQPIAVMQKALRFSMENTVGLYVKLRREVARFIYKAAPDGRERQRKFFQPRRFCLVDGEVFKLTKSADMIPMRMCKDDGNRKIRQPVDNLPDIFHAQARIDQDGSLASAKQVTVRLFPMF